MFLAYRLHLCQTDNMLNIVDPLIRCFSWTLKVELCLEGQGSKNEGMLIKTKRRVKKLFQQMSEAPLIVQSMFQLLVLVQSASSHSSPKPLLVCCSHLPMKMTANDSVRWFPDVLHEREVKLFTDDTYFTKKTKQNKNKTPESSRNTV